MSEKNESFFESSKGIFVFGLVTGVAVTSLLGNGINLPKYEAGAENEAVAVRQVADSGSTGGSADPAVLAPITEDDHILGDINTAKVVLVEYSDFECPFCSRHHPTMQQIMDEYGDDVAWVYRHFPLSFHPEARPAALASECAAEQGEFWAYGDALIENYTSLNDDLYFDLAGELGLNVGQFTDCYESEKYAAAVDEDYASGQAAGVTGTPATYINGQQVSGAVPFETLSALIDEELGN